MCLGCILVLLRNSTILCYLQDFYVSAIEHYVFDLLTADCVVLEYDSATHGRTEVARSIAAAAPSQPLSGHLSKTNFVLVGQRALLF